MFDELVKSFKANMYERMSSPFLSSLIIFFVYFNWKGLFVAFFGDETVTKRIEIIEKSYTNFDHNVYYPVLYAVVASLAYPFISLLFFAVQDFVVTLKRKLQNFIEAKATISIDKYIELKEEVFASNKRFEELLEGKDQESIALSKELSDLRENNSLLVAEVEELESKRGKQIGVDENKYSLFIDASNYVIERVLDQLSQSSNKSIASIWGNYGHKLGDIAKELGFEFHEHTADLSLLEAWGASIKQRMDEENYGNVVTELSELLRRLVSTAEMMRMDIKHVLEVGLTGKHQAMIGSENQIKEKWINARDEVNEIITKWTTAVYETVTDKDRRNLHIQRLHTIGDKVDYMENPSGYVE